MKTYKELLNERDQLDAEIAEVRATERDAAIREIHRLMADFEISTSEIGRTLAGAKGTVPTRRRTRRSFYVD